MGCRVDETMIEFKILKKKNLMVYIFTQKFTLSSKVYILGPPPPKNWQDDP